MKKFLLLIYSNLKKICIRAKSISLENKLSFLAFVVACLVAYYTKSHNEIMSTPILQISVFEKPGPGSDRSKDTVGLKIENLGLGPAKIIYSNKLLMVNDTSYDKIIGMSELDLKGQLLTLGWKGRNGKNNVYEWADIEIGSYMSVGKRKDLLKLINYRPDNWRHGKNVYASACYCSIHSQCFFVATNIYHEKNSCTKDSYETSKKLSLSNAIDSLNNI